MAICHECGLRGAKKDMWEFELYDTPWDDKPEIAYFHKEVPAKLKNDRYFGNIDSCDALLEDTSWSDFRYFECDYCKRMVCEQNPANGWHIQYRYLNNDADEKVCLRCYKQLLLRDGVAREELVNRNIPGMFLDSYELKELGYEVIIWNKQMLKKEDIEGVCNKAIELIDSGHRVIIGYEGITVPFGTHNITLYSKEI